MKLTSVLVLFGLLLPCTPIKAQGRLFAYIVNEGANAVSVYSVDPTTGALAPVSVAATGSLPTSIVADPTGRFAFVTNYAESWGVPSISVYTIEPNTGALIQIPGSPFPSSIPRPEHMTVHPSGKFLYVANNIWYPGYVSAFRIDDRTGTLATVPGSPYVTGNAGAWSVATDPAGKFLFVANGDNANVPVFSIDTSTGALTPVAGSPFPSLRNTLVDVVDPSGRFLYASTNSSSVSGYSINPNTGALTPVPSSPFGAGNGTTGIAMHPTGQFVYAANQYSQNVSAYRLDSSTGALSPVTGSPFPAGSGAFYPAVDPTGNFLYVANAYSNNVSAYTINAGTGALTPIPGSPFVTGTLPVWIAVVNEVPSSALSILPNHGGNAGTVTAQIFGSGFQSGATAKLTGLGPDIIGSNLTVVNSSVIKTTFDLTGSTPGVRNAVITNLDGTSATLTGGFTVEEGGGPQIWVDLIGQDLIRIGREQTFYIAYGNRGNVDADAFVAYISFPKSCSFIPDRAPIATGESPEGEMILLFDVPAVQASGSGAIPVNIGTPTDPLLANQPFTIRVWWDRPELESDVPVSLRHATANAAGSSSCDTPISCNSPNMDYGENGLRRFFNLFNIWVNKCPCPVPEPQWCCRDNCPAGSIPTDCTSVAGLDQVVVDGLVILQAEWRSPLIITGGSERDCHAPLGHPTGLKVDLRKCPSYEDIIKKYEKCDNRVDGSERSARWRHPAGFTLTEEKGAETHWDLDFKQDAVCHIDDKPKRMTQVGSLDPNGKFGAGGVGPQAYLSAAEPLRYSIAFENKDTATAPVQELVVTDQLDVSKVDLDTLSIGLLVVGRRVVELSGFVPFQTQVDLRPAANLIIKVSVTLDSQTGILTWRLTSIDPSTGRPPTDPLAGFLPPNVTPPEGQGSVYYSVMPARDVATGTEIRNRASIIFDTNPAIATPEWLNTIDNTKPTSKVSALPPTEATYNFPVQWAGTDSGAGIQDFTSYVSDNGGPFTGWLTNTTAGQAMYNGVGGHTYRFYSIARDLVGNVENGKTIGEATTRVLIDITPPVIVPKITGTLGSNGWYRTDVSVNWSITDPESGIATSTDCTPTTLTAETAGVTLTCRATNGAGLSNSVPITIKIDKTPPSISGLPASGMSLWSPNKKMVQVAIVTAADALSGLASFDASGTSNEPSDPKDPDIAITGIGLGPRTVQLRADRLGTGSGRIYTLTATATDLAGNTSTVKTTVVVPHDEGK